jgi:ribonuclease HIII
MSKEIKIVQVYMTMEMWKALSEKAKRDSRKLSNYCVKVLKENINKEIVKKVY